MLVHWQWYDKGGMATLDSRGYAKRIVATVALFKTNGATTEDYVEYLADLLDDYLSEYVARRNKRSGNPLSKLFLEINKGDYSAALLLVQALPDPELAQIFQILLEALLNGTTEELHTEGTSSV